jgi:hypothetical protein
MAASIANEIQHCRKENQIMPTQKLSIPFVVCQSCHLHTPAHRPRCVHCDKQAQALNCTIGARKEVIQAQTLPPAA